MEDMTLDFSFNRGEIHGWLVGNWNDAAGPKPRTCNDQQVRKRKGRGMAAGGPLPWAGAGVLRRLSSAPVLQTELLSALITLAEGGNSSVIPNPSCGS